MPQYTEDQIVSRASARFQRCSARKARLVADLIRGKTVAEANQTLAMTHRPSAGTIIGNLLKSAVANVDRNAVGDVEELLIGEITVDGGPIMYRFQPRARGRAGRIRKRFCHAKIKLVVED